MWTAWRAMRRRAGIAPPRRDGLSVLPRITTAHRRRPPAALGRRYGFPAGGRDTREDDRHPQPVEQTSAFCLLTWNCGGGHAWMVLALVYRRYAAIDRSDADHCTFV